MAKNARGGMMPVDSPIEVSPGVVQVERDFFADASPSRGIYEGFPTSPVSSRKGNLPPPTWPASAPLTGAGPFRNLRGGR